MPRSRTPALAALAALLVAPAALAGPSFNVIFHANLDEHAAYNDVWGYTAPNGDEYALLGTTDGLAVINVSDPANPYETGFFPGASSLWRDIKTLGHHAYVVNESGGGLAIVDLSDPESPVAAGAYTGGGFATAHNLYIDTATARAYLAGFQPGNGGFILLDLSNPVAPTEIGRWTGTYFHDVMVQNGRLYGSAIEDPRLVVLDVSNPAAITQLGTAEGYPAAFTHNAWVTPDDSHVLTTDETSASSCRMWDLSTLPNLVQTDAYKPNATTIPHNAHIEGDLAFISYYTLGVKILDVSDPSNLVEAAAWDTWPADDGGTFDGCWGAYPFFQTNPDLIVASDLSTGLWVLEYKGPLGTLAGEVTRTGDPATKVAGAAVEVLESGVRAVTDAAGAYALQDVAGAVNVQFSAFGYAPRTVPATIVTGSTSPLDVTLDLLPSGSVGGTVTDAVTSLPVAGATVALLSTPLSQTTSAAGAYLHDPVPAGPHTVRVTAFGYTPMEAVVTVPAGGGLVLDFPLNPAPVALDFETGAPGWTVSGGAIRGLWELADPEPTFSGGTPVNPGDDRTLPPGTDCWVTGPLAGSSLGAHDVDGGATILTSPDLAVGDLDEPRVSYWRWYSTGVGNANRDFFKVEVSGDGGSSWVVVEDTDETTNAWIEVDVALTDFVVPSNLVRFRFTAQDTGAGSITEAALDDFMIYDGVDRLATDAPVPAGGAAGLALGRPFPNPFRAGEGAALDLTLPAAAPVRATVHDVRGRRIAVLADARLPAGRHRLVWDGRDAAERPAAAGVYFLKLRAGEETRSRKLLLLR